jgi:hypothetical protein
MMVSTNSHMQKRTSHRSGAFAAAVLGLAMLTACAEEPAPVEPISATGTIAGIVFFDRDNNGEFTPTAGDSALSNVVVNVLLRGTDSVIARPTTGANGRWTASVPVGTHDIAVVRDPRIIAANLVYCGGPRPSVYQGEQTFVPTPVKFGCVVRINAAKPLAVNSTVTIAGVVVAQPGRFRTQGDNIYIQDPTGGVQVFGASIIPLGLQEGDSIEVTGEIALFNTQVQIVNPRVAPNIKRGAVIPPSVVRTTGTLAGITSGLSGDVGRLITVRKVQVGAFGFGGQAGNAQMNDGSGAAVLRLDGAAVTTIGTARFVSGRCYDITGILGFFNNAIQLQPRALTDVTEVSCT